MRRQRGFTLLETMIALTILFVACLGALTALMAASQNIKDGQVRQTKAALVEQRMQLVLLSDKTLIGTAGADSLFGTTAGSAAIYSSASALDTVAPNTAPWKPDPMGSYFSRTASGGLVAQGSGACDNATIIKQHPDWFCREVAIVKNLPGNVAPKAGTAYTFWVRVLRLGDPLMLTRPQVFGVSDREVFNL